MVARPNNYTRFDYRGPNPPPPPHPPPHPPPPYNNNDAYSYSSSWPVHDHNNAPRYYAHQNYSRRNSSHRPTRRYDSREDPYRRDRRKSYPRESERRRNPTPTPQIPISKESEDTLRNRIRNDNQLQEEKEKEHQDQVKDRVRELQKKLTDASVPPVQENGKEPPNSTTNKDLSSSSLPSTSTRQDIPSKSHSPPFLPRAQQLPIGLPFQPIPLPNNTPPTHPSSSKSKNSPKPSDTSKSGRKNKKKGRCRKKSDKKQDFIYDQFKASIVKKNPKYLKELIESPSFLKKMLMTKLVEEHRQQISYKLNQLRFDEGPNNDNIDSVATKEGDPFFEVDFKELPHDFVTEIFNLIQNQKQENIDKNIKSLSDPVPSTSTIQPGEEDEDIMEVPVPPKTPPPFVNLSDGEEVVDEEEKQESVDNKEDSSNLKHAFAENLSREIEILNAEESHVMERLEQLSTEKKSLNHVLRKIAETRNKLLLEAASLLKSK